MFYGTASARVPRAGEPRLVPVRLGGPWKKNGGEWEFWADGKHVCGNREGYCVREGAIWALFRGRPSIDTCATDKSLTGKEFRPPRDWTGDLPEGCCWATDFVKDQRVRRKGGPLLGKVFDVLSCSGRAKVAQGNGLPNIELSVDYIEGA